jgi:hypothetical protein
MIELILGQQPDLPVPAVNPQFLTILAAADMTVLSGRYVILSSPSSWHVLVALVVLVAHPIVLLTLTML